MNQNRFKSPVVWAAVVAQILTILIVLDVINVAQQQVGKPYVFGRSGPDSFDCVQEGIGDTIWREVVE